MILPIATVYRGHRFRSRLEARWAVFFDALSVRWEYEPEGFDLGDGIWYLPDFFLPDLRCWVEIKAELPTPEERDKCERLAEGTNRPAVIISGSPGHEQIAVFCSDCTDSGGGTHWWERGTTGGACAAAGPHWAADSSGSAYLCSGSDRSDREFMTPCWDGWTGMRSMSERAHWPDRFAAILGAQKNARRARFTR